MTELTPLLNFLSESERRVRDFYETLTHENNLEWLYIFRSGISLCICVVHMAGIQLMLGMQINLRNVAEEVNGLLLPRLRETRKELDGVLRRTCLNSNLVRDLSLREVNGNDNQLFGLRICQVYINHMEKELNKFLNH